MMATAVGRDFGDLILPIVPGPSPRIPDGPEYTGGRSAALGRRRSEGGGERADAGERARSEPHLRQGSAPGELRIGGKLEERRQDEAPLVHPRVWDLEA